jgi:anti-sigma factor RsiW
MNQRDLELLSTYLDGQLSPSDSTRLEARLKTDPELASVLTDLRTTRNLLRKLPQRRAPRNFTLTRKMVGQNPPLPRAYPVFRFATALATLLFIFSFGLNSFNQAVQTSQFGYGRGGGGCDGPGCSDVQSQSALAPAATQAPAATEAPAEQAPAPALAPLAATQVLTPEIANGAGIVDTPASKAGDSANAINPNQPLVQAEARTSPAPLIPSIWQTILAVIAIASGALMLLLRQISAGRWK